METTVAMTSEDAVYRGKALYVAEFLSTFQGFFRRNDAERKGPVSVELIERALTYRQRLLEHSNLQNEFAMHRKDGILTGRQIEEWENKVRASEASIESSPANVKAVHELIRRFEVWMTQSLANHVLTSCVKASPGSNKDKLSICCSPVLNTPGAAHFMTLMSQQSVQNNNGKNHVCGVGVPANAWTWQEYVRICNMVSCLPNREDAMKSTLTAASHTLVGQRKEELKLSEKDELTPADLVALWTRSQRNTSALLHLLKLFKVVEAPEEPREERYSVRASAECRGKTLVVEEKEESDSEEETEPRYIAEYVGNHKKTRNYVLKCSKRLDKLVEWAVANQALFTYRYIRESLSRTPVSDAEENLSSKKRPLPEEDVTEEIATKRRKRIDCEDEEKLLQACQCYILRWFARRNRKVTSIIFSSKLEQLPLFPYESVVAELQEDHVPKKIKKVLKQKYHSTNRTFSRIDRRVQLGNFIDEEQPDKTFHGAVVLLLKFLAKEVTASDLFTESEVRAACEDFEKLHNMFLSGKTAYESAEMLLDPDFDGDPTKLLLAFHEPYLDHCVTCTKALDKEEGGTFECDNCGKLFHNECQRNASVRSMSELIQSYPPLAQVNEAISDEMKPSYGESWRCSDCQIMSAPRANEQRIFAESRWCKALIRDLGMEAYSLPFHNEKLPRDSESDQSCDRKGSCRNVSLRRLDAMMEYISLKHDPSISKMSREVQLSSIGNPFMYPAEELTDSQILQPIDWVTEEMKKEPMRLLCKGIELLALSSNRGCIQSKDDSAAFLRHFTKLFCTWFLTDREETLPLQPSGSLFHALLARPPWIKPSCIVCCARPIRATDPEMPVCDNLCCQQIYSTRKDKQSRVPMHTASTGIDKLVSKYDELSALVGSPLIVLPGDPMLQFVSKELNTSIDHMDRPVIFFVASYLPREFAKSDPRSSMLDDEGVFHVLPVILGSQLEYLYGKSLMRQSPKSHTDDDSWARLDVLNVVGVVRMSAVELRGKLKETTAIRGAIDSALEELVWSQPAFDSTDIERHSLATKEQRRSSIRQEDSFRKTSDSISMHSTLIECLLRSQDPLVRNMIDMLCPAPTDNDDDFLSSIEQTSFPNEAGDSQDIDHHADTILREGSEDIVMPGEHSESKEETSTGVNIRLQADGPEAEIVATVAPRRNFDPARLSPKPLFSLMDQQIANTSNRQNHPKMATALLPIAPRPSSVEQSGIPQNVDPALQPFGSLLPNNRQNALLQTRANLNMITNVANVVTDWPADNVISRRDLHQPGLGFLSRAETAVYLEAASRGLHNLGLRLLCPRYNISLLRDDVGGFIRGALGYEGPKRVQKDLWDFIMNLDYQRALKEEGETVLSDTTTEGTYKYCIPFIPLPLDRIAEDFLTRTQRAVGRQLTQINRAENDEPPVNRIRGGGPSEERLFEIQRDSDEDDSHMLPGADEVQMAIQDGAIQPEMVNEPTALVETPRTSWPGTHVYASVATTFFGEGREEAVCLGVVQEIEPENIENARVAVFHFSNIGYLPEAMNISLPAANWFIIQEGSNHATIANQWEGLERLRFPRRVSVDGMDVDDGGPSEDNEATAESAIQQDMEAKTLVVRENSLSPKVVANKSRVSPSRVDESSERTTLQDDTPKISVAAEATSHFADLRNEDEEVEATVPDKPVDETTNDVETLIPLQKEETEVDDESQSDISNECDALADTPRDAWVNTLVFSDVMIEGEEGKVIGIVRERHDLLDCDQVTITLFHLSNIGYLDEARDYTLPLASVYIVQDGSSEARIAKQWRGLEDLLAANDDQLISDGLRPTPRRERGQTALPKNSSHKVLSLMQDVAKSFVKTLCQRRRGATPIGHLPDGRAVVWLQSDPRALYIRTHAMHKDYVITALHRESEEQLTCPWHCCCENDQELMQFETQTSLQEHLRIRHDFGQIQDCVVDVENTGRLYRIPEGRVVVSLSMQLSYAICACSPGLSELLDTSSSKAGTFRLDEVLEIYPEGLCSPQKRIVDALLHKPEAYLWGLWSAVARLFAVESTGLFRAATDDCETVLYVTNEEEPVRIFDREDRDDPSAEENGCLNGDINSAAPFESNSCHLCHSRWEFNNGDGSPLTGGAGCNLLCFSCRASNILVESIPALGTCGPSGVAKSMLIRIAASVPTHLRRRVIEKEGTDAASPVKEGLLWEEGNYQSWRFLVERSNTVRPLLQALVTLVHSLHISKLPKWWGGAREGWASAFATMASAQYGFPALFLRLYALDAAISEYMVLPSLKCIGDNAPSVLQRIPTTEGRMELVQQWANACDYRRCEKEHKSECSVCKDGGNLLCCEYCTNTQHPGCCVPVITDTSKLKIWACPLCVADLAVYVEAEDDDN